MKAVIFDIDGTIADMEHRLHHITKPEPDFHACLSELHKDEPIKPLVDLLLLVDQVARIILCTGRDEGFRRETNEWLMRHHIQVDRLLMRAEGDRRGDDVVKSEMLDQILADGYKVWFVVEDRSRVVAMWRRRGLTCLQCAPGDF